MKRLIILALFLTTIGLNSLLAQNGVGINEVECYNLGDGRYYCQEIKSKKPLEGNMRMIDGYTSQYTEAVFKKGIPNGSWKVVKNNSLSAEYTYKEGVLHGDYTEYYPDGSKKSARHFVNGKAEGEFVEYAFDGTIESEVNYRNGVQHGPEIRYDRDGSIRSSVTFAEGKETGAKKQLFSDYELTANYRNGKYDGDYSEIYTNGNLKVTGNYIDGKKNGLWVYYNKYGDKEKDDEYVSMEITTKENRSFEQKEDGLASPAEFNEFSNILNTNCNHLSCMRQ